MIRPRAAALLGGTLLAVLLLGAAPASAHPTPGTALVLTLHEGSATAELRMPVQDLTAAVGDTGPAAIRDYLSAHLRPATTAGQPWQVRIGDLAPAVDEQNGTGPFPVLVARAELTPPPGGDVHHFVLACDAIAHQVANHLIVVQAGGETIGVIATDIRTMTVPALTVDLPAPVLSGTDHHLLILLAVFLPIAVNLRRWGVVGLPGSSPGCFSGRSSRPRPRWLTAVSPSPVPSTAARWRSRSKRSR